MELTIFQVDAFAEALFAGNPAAVVPLKEWLPDHVLQNIAMENNLSETAFFIPEEKGFHLRWFTPTREVNLCGHGTLATAHILFNHLGFDGEQIEFRTRSGKLSVSRLHHLLFLDFPVSDIKNIPTPQKLTSGLGLRPLEVFTGGEYLMAIYKNESEIKKIHPDFPVLQKLPFNGIIATSQGNSADFVSRFFAPVMGIDEDPVTGSAHTLLIPYWSRILVKNSMVAHQISKRGGILHCELLPDRVKIGGKAVTYMSGTVMLDYPHQDLNTRTPSGF